jgi:hypothetical protein
VDTDPPKPERGNKDETNKQIKEGKEREGKGS